VQEHEEEENDDDEPAVTRTFLRHDHLSAEI
jgi:hypothetical protein